MLLGNHLDLFIHRRQERPPHFIKQDILPVNDSINTTIRQPVQNNQHLYRKRANPLEINKAGDVPVFVDKDVALVEIGGLEKERAVLVGWVDEVVRDGAEQRPNGQTLAGICVIADGVAVVEEVVVVEG